MKKENIHFHWRQWLRWTEKAEVFVKIFHPFILSFRYFIFVSLTSFPNLLTIVISFHVVYFICYTKILCFFCVFLRHFTTINIHSLCVLILFSFLLFLPSSFFFYFFNELVLLLCIFISMYLKSFTFGFSFSLFIHSFGKKMLKLCDIFFI